MGAFIPLIIWTVLLCVPLFFVVQKVGISKLWLFFFLIPMIGPIILLWVVAFIAWPQRKMSEVFE